MNENVFSLPLPEARTLLRRGVPVHVLVNPREYHGPHLSLLNDHLISDGLSRALYRALGSLDEVWGGDGPYLTAGELGMGVLPTPGPGTEASSFEDVAKRVEALARALVDLGAHFVVAGTFHGDPLHNMAIHRGLAPLRRSGARVAEPFLEALRALTRGAATEYDAALLPIDSLTLRHAVRESLPFDFHAGYVETSLALYFACDSVDTAHRSVSPCPRFRVAEPWARLSANARRLGRSALADELRMVGIATGWHALRPFPGYTGFPGLASREAGRVYGEALVELYLETVRGVFQGTGAATSPPLAWLEWLTARGRLA